MENSLSEQISKRKIILFFIVSVLFVYHLFQIKPEYTFALDSFIKLIQTVSLKLNKFTSETLFYFLDDIDPNRELYPIPLFKVFIDGKMISPFPVSFAILNAIIINFIPWKYLPYLCLLVSLISYFLINKLKPLSLETYLLCALGTPFIFQGLEFSENPLLLFFQIISLAFFYKGKTNVNSFFTGFFWAIGIWLRLEIIVFTFFFLLFIFRISYQFKILEFLKSEKFFLIGLSLPVISFCITNLYLYDHFLGPRFLANSASLQAISISGKASQVWNLLFLEKMKIGYFGFTPIFLWVFVYFVFKNNLLNEKDKIIHATVICFLPVIAFFSPNDGVTNWGARYLNLAIIPGILLYEPFYKNIINTGSKKLTFLRYSLLFYSILVLVIGLRFQSFASKELKYMQEELKTLQGDFYIFGAESIALYSGGEYISIPSILPKDSTQLKLFLESNRDKLKKYKKIIFSRVVPNPMVAQGIQMGMFPKEEHYDEIIKILSEEFELEKKLQGKRIITYAFIHKKE